METVPFRNWHNRGMGKIKANLTTRAYSDRVPTILTTGNITPGHAKIGHMQ